MSNIQLDPYNKDQPFSKKEISFEDAWCDVYWVFAHDDMAFDYRASYYRERYLKVKKGVIDFEAMTLERE
tara:strand:- start:134 stop:343 length:210 start_codon:yes stop_codon:yes gene_type:complete